ncbi:MAG: cell division protein FtsA [Chitinophagaceae bacterium]|nr:cell division protein FtsA [Chitinophagaceae bacterium]
MNNENPIIVGLDIGTTKIAAIAGRKNQYGKLEILAFGRADSSGVNHGEVMNVEECIRSIQVALNQCLAFNPHLQIKEVYVGIAGRHIKSIQNRGERVVSNAEEVIRKEDIEALIRDQYKTCMPIGDDIIDIIPQDFTVGSVHSLTRQQVIGMSGVKVSGNFHIISGDRGAIRNIHRSVTHAGLKTKDLVLQPLASAAAVMNADDLEAGVAIVDIGGGTTDLAVFHDGILKHTAVIPMAGVNITNDIRQGLGVLRSQAEQMKVQFGVALEDHAKPNAFITIPGLKGQQPKEISARNLAKIIEARMVDILDYVQYHLKEQQLMGKLNSGIILTGGGSQLSYLPQLTEFRTGMHARVGYPNEHLAGGYIKEFAKPMYATAIGLILRGYDDFENSRQPFVSFNDDKPVNVTEQEGEKAPVAQPLSIEEELQAQFGDSTIMPTASGDENPVYNQPEYTPELTSQEQTPAGDLFNQPAGNAEQALNETEKVQKRRKTIRDVFATVKPLVLSLFDGLDDKPFKD